MVRRQAQHLPDEVRSEAYQDALAHNLSVGGRDAGDCGPLNGHGLEEYTRCFAERDIDFLISA